MDKYALGTDIPIRWTLGEYTPAESVYFEIYTGAGRKRVTDFTIDGNVLSWTFSGSDQSAYGVYGLHLIAGSQEYRLDNAFELIHGTPSEQPEPQSLSSSVDIGATTPQEEPSESTGPAEYVSDSPIHVEKIPLGSNIILNWNLLTTESFDFDLEECDLALYYSAAGSGKKQATDFTLLTENGYTVQWNFAGADQTRYGLYSLFLDIYYEGEKIATLVREDGFALVHRRGSEFLADRIISFDSVVTTLGGGALYSLADVLNDGYSTVYREDGETPAAQGDILLFDGEKWVASNDADLGSTDRLAEQITALTTRVSGDEDDIAALGRNLAAAQVTIGSNTSRIARNEADILDINTALSGLSGSIRNLNEDVAAIQISEAGIATRVTDAEGNISSLQQTAAGFDLRVSDVEGDVGELTLTSEALAGRISDAEGDIGVLELTATGLTTRITSAEGDIGALELTASSLTTRIANTEGDVSTLQQTATGLTSRVSDAEGNISVLQQTATGLQYQVDNQSGDIATLKVSAQGLTSRVSNAEGDISSIQQQADSIELSVEGLSTEVTRYEGITDAALANLQDQIDGVVETWYFEGVPSLTEPPVMSSLTHPYDEPWLDGTETPEERTTILNNHIGDLYYEKITGKAYRFMYDDSLNPAEFVWKEIEDEDIAKALGLAGEKKRVFVANPYPPYDIGDLWAKERTVNGTTTREIYRCVTARAAGATPDLANDWAPADDYAVVVSKANIQILSDSILSTVGTYSYNSDGTLDRDTKSFIEQTASSIRLATVVDNVALAGITIDATNQTGSVTIFSDNFYIKDGSYNKTALAITHDALGNSIIDVDSINVNGILSAPRILSSKIEMVDGSNNVTAGLSGIYDSTKTGYGMAAWYGGPMVDLADHLTDDPIPAHAKTLFRMDGSGYLADRRLYWSDQGDLHIQGNVTIDGQNYTETLNSILGYVMKLASWFVEDDTTMTGKTLLRINMGSQSSEGFDGLIFDGFLITGGDQIVGSGTPGGGGGGAGFLYELGDVYHDQNKTKVLRDPDYATTTGQQAQPGDVLVLDSTHGWAAVPSASIGGVTSVVGQTGDVTAQQISTAIGLGNYLPLSAGSSYPLTGALYVNANTSYALYLRGHSQYSIIRYLDSSGNNVVDIGWVNDNRGNLAYIGNLSSGGILSLDVNGCYYSNDNTPKKYTIYHSGNDGASSGLDADLLDGQHGSYYNNLLAYYDSGATSANSVTYPLSLLSSGTPSTTWHYVTTMFYSTVGGNQASQIATSYNASTPGIWIRQKSGGTWSDWTTVLTSANYSSYALPLTGGTMSNTNVVTNLNADLLDGRHLTQIPYLYNYGVTDIGNSTAVTVNDLASYLASTGMIYAATDNPRGAAGWVHVWSQTWSGSNTNWVSQIAVDTNSTTGLYYRANSSSTIVGKAWTRVWDNANAGSTSYPWSASSLTLAGAISGATDISASGTMMLGTYADDNHFLNLRAGYNSINYSAYVQLYQGVLHIYNGYGNTNNGINIDASCNVGLGTGTGTEAPAAKLDVRGQARFLCGYFPSTDPALGALATGTVRINASTSNGGRTNYGLYSWVDFSTGNAKLQVGREDGSTTTYALCLNPLGGNVGIGTASPGEKLDVEGFVRVIEPTSKRFFSRMSTASVGFYNDSTKYTSAWNCRIACGKDMTDSGVIAGAYMSNGTIQHYWYGGAAENSAAMYIKPNGQVGIGSSSVQTGYRLTVSGAMTLSGVGAGDMLRITTPASYCAINLYPTSSYQWSIAADTNARFYWWNSRANGIVAQLSYDGTLTTTGDQVISSDIIWKTNLQPVKYTIEDIAKCRAVTFDWKDGRGKSAGSIAQDWKPLIPELAHGEEGNMTLAYGQIALINSILLAKHETEQDKEIKKLREKVQRLEEDNLRLKARLNMS